VRTDPEKEIAEVIYTVETYREAYRYLQHQDAVRGNSLYVGSR
jgi:hypothetical protein